MDGSGHDDSALPIMAAGGGEEPHPADTVPPDPQAGPSPFHAYLLVDLLYWHSSSSRSSSYVIQALPACFEIAQDDGVGAPGTDDDGAGMMDIEEYDSMIGDGDDHEYHIHDHDDAYRDGGFSAVPASDEAIVGLAEAAASETREAECAVCLEGFQQLQEGDKIRKMRCSHCFHESCIFQWLRVSRVCPCCRFELPAAAAAVEMGTERENERSAIEHESEDDDEEDYIPYIFR